MVVVSEDADLEFEQLEYDQRYYIQTAKNSIESLGHIVAEAGSNEDEAISRRAKRDGTADDGWIQFEYNPESERLIVTGDGDGMTGDVMWERLRRVGAEAVKDSKRGFFHRGIREVFLAMGGGRVISIGKLADGTEVLSEAVFDPHQGMALITKDATPAAAQRDTLGLAATGTRVEIPMRRFVRDRPGQFTFPKMEQQIRDCVGIRPVLADPAREVRFVYWHGAGAPAAIRVPGRRRPRGRASGDDRRTPCRVLGEGRRQAAPGRSARRQADAQQRHPHSRRARRVRGERR